jgi:hypothetical protein
VEGEERRARLSAIYSAAAFVTVPFLMFVVPRMLFSLHPDPLVNTSGKIQMDPRIRISFFALLIGFTGLFVWMLSLRVRVLRVARRFAAAPAGDIYAPSRAGLLDFGESDPLVPRGSRAVQSPLQAENGTGLGSRNQIVKPHLRGSRSFPQRQLQIGFGAERLEESLVGGAGDHFFCRHLQKQRTQTWFGHDEQRHPQEIVCGFGLLSVFLVAGATLFPCNSFGGQGRDTKGARVRDRVLCGLTAGLQRKELQTSAGRDVLISPLVACGEIVERLPERDRFCDRWNRLLQSLVSERGPVEPIAGLAGDFDKRLGERLFPHERDMRRQD